MKAIRIHRTGGPEVLLYEDAPDPTVEEGQALIEIQAIGVNYTDVLSRSAANPPSTLPWIPGHEVAGRVIAVGSGVKGLTVGDLVASTHVSGAYAQRAAVPWEQLVKLPPDIDVSTGAAIMLQGLTAHYLAHTTYPFKKGDKALIHAGAGGVGLLLIQMVKQLGAFVFTTVSTPEKAKFASEAGADHVINYTQEDFEEVIREATDGEGVQVVYDSVGKATFDQSLNSLATRGLLVMYGQASGMVPPISPWILVNGSRYITWPSLWDHIGDRASLLQRTSDLFNRVASGKLKVHIGHTFPLAEAAEAHRQLEGRKTIGKVLLIP